MNTLIWNQLTEQQQQQALQRPAITASQSIQRAVDEIVDAVRQDGDKALLALTAKFDKVELKSLVITKEEIEQAAQRIPTELKTAIKNAKQNIEIFHQAQKPQVVDLETQPGVRCEVLTRPINRVGLYIPGGTAPLFPQY